MAKIPTFNFMLNKERVFNAMQCDKNSPVYDQMDKTYESLYTVLQNLELPASYFDVIKKEAAPENLDASDYHYLGYSLISIGDQVLNTINTYFSTDEYLKGLMLDYMCDDLLFEYSNQLLAFINNNLGCDSKGITKIFAPGDDDIDLSYHQWIVAQLSKKHEFPYPITVNPYYVISPVKSLTCFFLIKDNTTSIALQHHCKQCKKDCLFAVKE